MVMNRWMNDTVTVFIDRTSYTEKRTFNSSEDVRSYVIFFAAVSNYSGIVFVRNYQKT